MSLTLEAVVKEIPFIKGVYIDPDLVQQASLKRSSAFQDLSNSTGLAVNKTDAGYELKFDNTQKITQKTYEDFFAFAKEFEKAGDMYRRELANLNSAYSTRAATDVTRALYTQLINLPAVAGNDKGSYI